MRCAHCTIEFHDQPEQVDIGQDVDGYFCLQKSICPSCKRFVLKLEEYHYESVRAGSGFNSMPILHRTTLVRPKAANRPPCPVEVPANLSEDYNEACLVLVDSPKASAALSRRCLQNIIHNHLGIKKRDLNAEIEEVIDQQLFPIDILNSIDAIRAIGNFAAHPIKSTSSGEVVPVEPQEAEWNLDVLEMIFEHQFVRPEKVKKKREALNLKLKDAGKPEMK